MRKNEEEFQYTKEVIRVPMTVVFLMWFVYWMEIKFQINFTRHGVFPRTISGLQGILFSPFIHGDIKHLFNNTIPIFVFLGMLFYFYRALAWRVLLLGLVLSGFGTWLIGVKAFHIGMSGLVYMLFSFIFFSGMFRKYYRLLAVSLIVIFLYGSMVWYVFPIDRAISWEGHLSGLISGLAISLVYRKMGPQQKKHQFTKNEFDTWFDEEGNFNPPQPEVEDESDENLLA
ncbi:rhomboid family intramembrane serine protease [Flavicella sediminum]|uniref:rhomboid family intramembrane serine protease n=1 Tax=Flavicella sediminum TaxID=2585141 RepID=UPI00111EEC9D|nr:rhomboid family intramembrane serine protease [Flavicella sediminum]